MTAVLLWGALALAETPAPPPCGENPVVGCVEEAEERPETEGSVDVRSEPPVVALAPQDEAELSPRQKLYYGIIDMFIWLASGLLPAGHAAEGALLLIDKLLEVAALTATGALAWLGWRSRRREVSPKEKRRRHQVALLTEQNNLLRTQADTIRTSHTSALQELQAARAAALRAAGHEV